MAKKKRKKLKKILGAALLGGLGLAAARSKRNQAIDAGIDAAEADKGSDMLPDTSSYITQKAAPIHSTFAGGIHQGKTPKGDIVKRMRNNMINTAEGSPLIDNPYVRIPPGNMRTFNSKGGRVTGIAKRGFGRALMKGKK